MTTPSLGTLELTVLLAVARLGDDAHGLAIRADVSARMRHDYSVGAIYTTLQRLEEKGFVTSFKTEPLAQRGGRSRRQFKVSGTGHRALGAAQRIAASVWDGVQTTMRPKHA